MPRYYCVKCGEPITFWHNQYNLMIHASCLSGEEVRDQAYDRRKGLHSVSKKKPRNRTRYEVNHEYRD